MDVVKTNYTTKHRQSKSQENVAVSFGRIATVEQLHLKYTHTQSPQSIITSPMSNYNHLNSTGAVNLCMLNLCMLIHYWYNHTNSCMHIIVSSQEVCKTQQDTKMHTLSQLLLHHVNPAYFVLYTYQTKIMKYKHKNYD